MRVGQAIALSVLVFAAMTGHTTTSAQQRSDSAQSKGLKRIFRSQARDSRHPNIVRLEYALSELTSDPLAKDVASNEIELARSSLDEAIVARRKGRESYAERAEMLVDAALLLATRKIALERARTALRETKRGAVKAEKATKQAADALEEAMQRRAALYLGQKK